MKIIITLNTSNVVGINSDAEIKTEIRNVIESMTYRGLIYDYGVEVIR